MPTKKKKVFGREPAKNFGYKKSFHGRKERSPLVPLNKGEKERSESEGLLIGIYKQMTG